MAHPRTPAGASPEKSPESRQGDIKVSSANHRSRQQGFLSVKTPLLPRNSGFTMESARNYGADVEKRPSKEDYEALGHEPVEPPKRRSLTWAAALVVFGVTAVAFLQGGLVYEKARSVVVTVVAKHGILSQDQRDEQLSIRQAASSNSSNSTQPLVPLALTPLPLGSIKPLGWLATEMQSMADGLAGNEMDFYPIVSQSTWLGGGTDYSQLNEGFPYWLNGLTPLAYGLGDQRLIGQVQKSVNYVISQQNPSNGFLGPVTYNDARDLWSRYPLMLGLKNVAEADSSMTSTILDTMYKFIPHANDLLADGSLVANNEAWARSRYADMILTLQWLYETHPTYNGTDQRGLLMQMMNRLKSTGIDWAGYYTEQSYLFNDIDTIPDGTSNNGQYFPFLHGVNVGQGLKTMAVNYRFTHNESLLPVQKDAVDWTFQYHGAASGTILGDERESSLAPNRGSELCTAVETLFSLHTLYSITGDNEYADRAEMTAFNALPVMLTHDNWAHQYIATPNQPWAAPLAGGDIFWNVGDFGTTFGTSPNYPCCTVNHPQGFPKFVASTFMTMGNDGLAHVLLAPSSVKTTLGNGANVTVAANTDYPFSDVLSYQINSDAPFTFYIRVPGWSSSPSLTVNGKDASVSADSTTGLQAISVPSGQSTVQYILKSTLHTVPRANDTIAIYRGALLYALDVGITNTSTPGSADITRNQPPTNDPSVDAALAYYTNASIDPTSEPAGARDYNFSNTMPWNYAIDEISLKFFAYNGSGSGDAVNSSSTVLLEGETTSGDASGKVPQLVNPIFEYRAPSQYVTGQACLVEWSLLGNAPFRPPLKGNRTCQGDPVEVVFRPYGSLKLHMAELPTVSLSGK